jgi:hypothetical protein
MPQGIVPSLRDSTHEPTLPGTAVPGYRLCRPYGTVFVAKPACSRLERH